MTARDDERSLTRVVADSDWKLACAIAGTTDTDPQLWFELLQDGKPFLEIQQLDGWLHASLLDDVAEARFLARQAGLHLRVALP